MFGGGPIGIADLGDLARGEGSAVLSSEAKLHDRLTAGRRLLEETLGDAGSQVYGAVSMGTIAARDCLRVRDG